MSCIEISGGGLSPEDAAKAIREATENQKDAQQIRLFNVDLARLKPDEVVMLEKLVNSRLWNRVVVSICRGHLTETTKRGLLQTKRLELYGNDLGLLGAYAEISSMPAGSSVAPSPLENLKLRTSFDHESVIPLATLLAKNRTLKALNLTCEFTDWGAACFLALGLEKNQHLEALTLYSCELFDDSSMKTIIRSLVDHPALSALALQDNSHFGMEAIVELVSCNKHLKSLHLYHPPLEIDEVKIPQVDIDSVSEALGQNACLESLDLSNNGLHDGSAARLAEALTVNTTLRSLNLQGNMICDEGAINLGNALPAMKGLKELYLWNNRFNGAGARALLAGLKDNIILETITIFSGFRVGKEIQYYSHLNRAGRCMLKDPNSLPMNVWPLVLDRVNSQGWEDFQKSSVLYTLLREGPAATAT